MTCDDFISCFHSENFADFLHHFSYKTGPVCIFSQFAFCLCVLNNTLWSLFHSCLFCLVSLVCLDLPLVCVYIAPSLYLLFLKSCTCFSSTCELWFPIIFLHFYFFFLVRNPSFLVCLFFTSSSQSCFACFF